MFGFYFLFFVGDDSWRGFMIEFQWECVEGEENESTLVHFFEYQQQNSDKSSLISSLLQPIAAFITLCFHLLSNHFFFFFFLYDPTSVGWEKNETSCTTMWKSLTNRRILKIVKKNSKEKIQKRQYLLTIGLNGYTLNFTLLDYLIWPIGYDF